MSSDQTPQPETGGQARNEEETVSLPLPGEHPDTHVLPVAGEEPGTATDGTPSGETAEPGTGPLPSAWTVPEPQPLPPSSEQSLPSQLPLPQAQGPGQAAGSGQTTPGFPPAWHEQEQFAQFTQGARVGTVVWGLLIIVLAGLIIVSRLGLVVLEGSYVLIGVMLGAGAALVIGGLLSAASRRRARLRAAAGSPGRGDGIA
ncbi:hypothetical protein [Arthrobacter sp. NPDC090010]|uniref:hypothetical protein n=1 Tax=Arthrobacter sp. NPDC090010 TaxID=3363942 RepID=UPI003821E1AF